MFLPPKPLQSSRATQFCSHFEPLFKHLQIHRPSILSVCATVKGRALVDYRLNAPIEKCVCVRACETLHS